MANTQAVSVSFKADILNGKHAFGTSVVRASTAADSFFGALYLTSGSLGSATTAYSATSELTGTGYTAGGQVITNATAPATSGTTAYWTPSANLTWTGLTSAGAFDTLLVYNNTAAGKNAVCVLTFGAQSLTAGTFTLSMPANAAGTAMLNLA